MDTTVLTILLSQFAEVSCEDCNWFGTHEDALHDEMKSDDYGCPDCGEKLIVNEVPGADELEQLLAEWMHITLEFNAEYSTPSNEPGKAGTYTAVFEIDFQSRFGFRVCDWTKFDAYFSDETSDKPDYYVVGGCVETMFIDNFDIETATKWLDQLNTLLTRLKRSKAA